MLSKKHLYLSAGIIVLAIIIWAFAKEESPLSSRLETKVKKGEFVVDVVTTGNLQAIQSKDIYAPMNLRKMGIHQITVSRMAEEGSIVDSGDFVAELDPSEILTELKKMETQLSQKQSELHSTQLDTTLNMRQEREKLLNEKLQLEEDELEVEQSAYEPPATQRKAQINLEKTKRQYTQSLSNIKLKAKKAEASVFKVQSELSLLEDKYHQLEQLLNDLVVRAPQKGMLVYFERWGEKIKPGSKVNMWNPALASIPDLSQMKSETVVNEIDISKVQKGQKVVSNYNKMMHNARNENR